MYIQRTFAHQEKMYCLFIWESRWGRGLDSWSLSEWRPVTEYWYKIAGNTQDTRPRSQRASVVSQIKNAGIFAS
jgi:hypothetical protein